jgi:hypothetical protein
MKKKIILFICLSSFLLSTNHRVLEAKKLTFGQKASTAGKLLTLAYIYAAASIFAHESGHATVSKFLTGSKIDIHLGALSGSKLAKNYLFKTKNVTIHTLLPLFGFARYEKEADTKLKKNLITAAGGLFQIPFGYLALAAVVAINKYKECGNLKKSIANGLKNALFSFQEIKSNKSLSKSSKLLLATLCMVISCSIIEAASYAFFPQKKGILGNLLGIGPLAKRNDGNKIWTRFGITEKTQKLVATMNSLLTLIGLGAVFINGYKVISEIKKA